MNFYLIGIDHRRAPIDIRESLFWKRKAIADFWSDRSGRRVAILSTCNRLEIYGIAENAFEADLKITSFKNVFNEFCGRSYYLYGEKNVLRHLVCLAAGLESQIKGESQIYSQLTAWIDEKDFPEGLIHLVREALFAGHAIRVREKLNTPENNIAALVYDHLSAEIYPSGLLNIVVAGTGKIAELFARYKPQGVRLYFAAHKNILRAGELAVIAEGEALSLEKLPVFLRDADIFISATSSPHRVFSKNYFSKIAGSRKSELYVYDLAVPRDVAPEAGEIEGIILKNIDEVLSNVKFKGRDEAEYFGIKTRRRDCTCAAISQV